MTCSVQMHKFLTLLWLPMSKRQSALMAAATGRQGWPHWCQQHCHISTRPATPQPFSVVTRNKHMTWVHRTSSNQLVSVPSVSAGTVHFICSREIKSSGGKNTQTCTMPLLPRRHVTEGPYFHCTLSSGIKMTGYLLYNIITLYCILKFLLRGSHCAAVFNTGISISQSDYLLLLLCLGSLQQVVQLLRS